VTPMQVRLSVLQLITRRWLTSFLVLVDQHMKYYGICARLKSPQRKVLMSYMSYLQITNRYVYRLLKLTNFTKFSAHGDIVREIFFQNFFLHCLSNIGNDTSELQPNSNKMRYFVAVDVMLRLFRIVNDDYYCQEKEFGACHRTQSQTRRVADVVLERYVYTYYLYLLSSNFLPNANTL